MKVFKRIKKRFKTQKLLHNAMNKGFSLIEVLIAMIILAIITLPILSSFASAAKINSNARKQENANAVAQKMIEQFKALPVSQLTTVDADGEKKETGVAGFTTQKAVDTSDPDKQLIYTFKMASFGDDGKSLKDAGEPYYVGANGEKFFVQVTLDPTSYAEKASADATDNKANNINTYEMPAIEDVSTNSNYVIAQQVYNHDMGIITAIKDPDDKDTDIGYSDIRREVTINSKVIQNGSVNLITGKNPDGTDKKEDIPIYQQSLSFEVKYVVTKAGKYYNKEITYKYDDHTFATTDNIILNAAQINKLNTGASYNDFKNIYLFYGAFDKYESILTNPANDKINVKYDYPAEITNDKQNLNVYLVEQVVNNKNIAFAGVPDDSESKRVHINRDNVQLYVNSNLITKTISGTLILGNAINTGAVNVYSNIIDWDKFITSATQKNNITQSKTSSDTKSYLYNIKVEIWVGEKTGNAFLTMTSTKEN